jgi:hypothetical protein
MADMSVVATDELVGNSELTTAEHADVAKHVAENVDFVHGQLNYMLKKYGAWRMGGGLRQLLGVSVDLLRLLCSKDTTLLERYRLSAGEVRSFRNRLGDASGELKDSQRDLITGALDYVLGEEVILSE